MANYDNLKKAISDAIKTNGNNEITGEVLQNALLTIISTIGENATFTGTATPITNPGSPDQNVFYLISEPGIYSNFGGLIVNYNQLYCVFSDGSGWKYELILDDFKDTTLITELCKSILDSPQDNLAETLFYSNSLIKSNGQIGNGYAESQNVSVFNVEGYQLAVISGRSPGNTDTALASVMDSENNVIKVYEIGKGVNYSDYYIVLPKGSYKLNVYREGSKATCKVGMFSLKELVVPNDISNKYIEQKDFYVLPNQTIGSAIAFGDFGSHRKFSIEANKIVRVEINKTGQYGFAMTDESGNVLECCSSEYFSEYTFKKYNFATYLYASVQKIIKAELLELYSVYYLLDDLLKRISVLENQNKQSNYWDGKNIWWCGTSIPAGSDETLGSVETIAGNYPTQVGENLNANVINKAVGGSMCRANVRTGDYNGANFSNITSCLSITKEEIENFISNYDSIKGKLTGGAPSTLDASSLSRLRAASFEDRLLPYLDGTYTMPDLFVIDHGHNDFKYNLSNGKSDIGLEPTIENITNGELAEDTYMTDNNNQKLSLYMGDLSNIPSSEKENFIASLNRNCFIGSINFIVTLILRYNPRARIVFISNYEYENGIYKSYSPLIPAQEYLSKSWAFPLCKVWEYLGYSDHIIPNSKDWFNEQYPNVTPATTDVKVFRVYNPDTVHPHSDTSGEANRIYAGVISEFINKIR